MKKIIGIVIVCMFLLTGCMQRSVVAEKQGDMIVEYMAGMLLKRDKNYQSVLIQPEKDEEVIDNIIEINDKSSDKNISTKKQNRVENTMSTKKYSSNSSLSEVIGTKDFDIQYMSYKIYDTYPEDIATTYFSLTPRKGYQLLVTSFSVQNITKDELSLDLSSAKINYLLDINVGTMYKPLLTLLENDLQYKEIKLKAGENESVLLIFEVSKELDMSNINLIVSKENKTEIVGIK